MRLPTRFGGTRPRRDYVSWGWWDLSLQPRLSRASWGALHFGAFDVQAGSPPLQINLEGNTNEKLIGRGGWGMQKPKLETDVPIRGATCPHLQMLDHHHRRGD